MRVMIYLLLMMTTQLHAAWDSSVLIGEWEAYQFGYDHKYQKLKINPDFSGSYYVISGASEGLSVNFKKSDITFFDGFAVINIDENFRMLLSAWGKRSTGDTTRLLGQLFIYVTEGSELKLINSEPLSFHSATGESFKAFSDRIK